MKILIDTRAVFLSVSEPEKLSIHGKRSLSHTGAEIFVSMISCAEIACAVDRGTIALDRHWKIWFRNYIELNGWRIVPIDLEIMEEAYSLPEYLHRNPADRIIVATARKHHLSIVTADRRMLDYPHVETIW